MLKLLKYEGTAAILQNKKEACARLLGKRGQMKPTKPKGCTHGAL
jgi:hypothetical protein